MIFAGNLKFLTLFDSLIDTNRFLTNSQTQEVHKWFMSIRIIFLSQQLIIRDILDNPFHLISTFSLYWIFLGRPHDIDCIEDTKFWISFDGWTSFLFFVFLGFISPQFKIWAYVFLGRMGGWIITAIFSLFHLNYNSKSFMLYSRNISTSKKWK